jgi:hypothetical protein
VSCRMGLFDARADSTRSAASFIDLFRLRAFDGRAFLEKIVGRYGGRNYGRFSAKVSNKRRIESCNICSLDSA